MAKVTVYSKLPISVKFTNPANNHVFELKGMNSHVLDVAPNTPQANIIDEEDWQFVKDKYGERKSYFDKINGDMFFTAKNVKESKAKMDDSKPVIEDQFLVTKTAKINQYKEDSLG